MRRRHDRILLLPPCEPRSGLDGMRRRIAGALIALAALGCGAAGSAAAGGATAASAGPPAGAPADSIVKAYPWPGGTLTWTGAISGSRTFKTVFCSVNGDVGVLRAPGEPMSKYPTREDPFMTDWPQPPDGIDVMVAMGADGGLGGGTLSFRVGRFHDKEELMAGVSTIKRNGRYAMVFHNAVIGIVGPLRGGDGSAVLNGTLWCNRVVDFSLFYR